MHALARVCVQRPVFATVLSLALVVVGVAGYMGLGIDRFPNVDFPMVIVSTVLQGASPEEVETEVTDKIERQVNTIGGIERLESSSGDGISLVQITFDLNKNVDVAAEEVRGKVQLAKPDLPDGVDEPVVMKMDIGAMPVISYAISSNRGLRETYEYVDKKIRRRIESVSGVGEVRITGGRERQIEVILDPYRMRAYGITASDITKALGNHNAQVPGGLVEQGDQQLSLRTRGRIGSIADFGLVPVKTYGDRQVLVRDVARVVDGEARAVSLASLDGQEAVVIDVIKQSGTNAVAVTDSVKERILQLQGTLPAGYSIRKVRDDSVFIRASLHAVEEHLILGAVLAALIVLLFLKSARSTIIAALAIPTSIVTTFALMQARGFTLNMITLLALALSVGIVIDDAIVVLENVFRVLEEHRLSPREAAIQATREIGLAVLAITLSLVAVFLPVAFMAGIVGRFLNSFGITMAMAILVSMFVAFSLTPMLCSRWLRPADIEAGHGESASKGGWYGVVDAGYTRLLEWALHHRVLVAVACVLLICSTVPLGMVARINFLPDDDQGQFQVLVRAPEGTSLSGTRRIVEDVAAQIRKLPEVALTLVTLGDDNERTPNSGRVFVQMSLVEDRQDRRVTQDGHMSRVRQEIIKRYEGRGLRLSVQPASSFGGGSNANIQLSISGPDMDTLLKVSNDAVNRTRAIPGVADVDTTLVSGRPELQAFIDRERAATFGVNVLDVAQALRLSVGGDDKITSYDEGGEQYDVKVRLEPGFRRDESGINLIEVPSDVDGRKGSVTLDQVVGWERVPGPASIKRFNRQRQFTLLVNLLPQASEGAVRSGVDQVIDGLGLGSAYQRNYIGRSREFARMRSSFLMAFVLSSIFMFLVIAAQFESFIQALVIMAVLPLTVPFAILSINLTRDSLNIFSLLGMLVLLGVVKKNAILQADRANQLRAQGMSLHDAVVQAARDRLRPILMTTAAFVAGMVPLVLSHKTGAATNRSTGGVIVGGQVFSLLLTLVAAPVFYAMVDNLSESWVCRVIRRVVFRHDVTQPRFETPLPNEPED
ncbi:MAG: efflux RND transporter permease subunit [Armatimonadetes bacterium]|nr:efflux RND transporter permease subunit [Armatimonadota bacterium]